MSRAKSRQRIYILPTSFGAVFILGAVVMILIGSAYQNNLVNMLAFFMLSLIFICMIQTHNNLKDLIIEGLENEGGFEGDSFLVTTNVGSEASVDRFNLESRLHRTKTLATYNNVLALNAGGHLKLRATYAARGRGKHEISRVQVSTVYPLGLFRSWRVFKVNSHYFVYPARTGDRPLPQANVSGEDAAKNAASKGGDDFHGHRKFREGDSHRHLDWKAHARGRPGLVKEFDEGARGTLLFDYDSLGGLDLEARLSQLATWIEQAQQRKLVYALRVPGTYLPANEGAAHAVKCWEILATFEPPEGAPRHAREG